MKAGKKKIIYGILAVLCVAALAVVAIRRERMEQLQEEQYLHEVMLLDIVKEYEMVVLGDSVLGQIRDETAIPQQVADALGLSIYNGALGGTCMGRLEWTVYQSDIREALSFVSLSKAIASKDFRVQNLVRLDENGTAHFPDVLAELSQIDFSKTKLLLIGYGANDYHAGELIESEDSFDEHTYTGAMRSAIRTLQNTYPDMRIVMITPTYTWYTELGLTCEEYVRGGYVLEDYVNAAIEVARELGLEIIDLYHGVYPHEEWEDWQKYSVDGLHPNEEGRDLLSQIVIEYLTENDGE